MLSENYYSNLRKRLIKDLTKIGVQINFDIEIKMYSKTYHGYYHPVMNKIVLFVHEDAELKRVFNYGELLSTLIHESVHAEQWLDPNFVRYKGIMHNAEFYDKYNRYINKAKLLSFRKLRIGNEIPKRSNSVFYETVSVCG